jgi:drug/metabolite transporter (DMT)-like permease
MKKIGVIEVILSGICFGFLGLFGKKAFQFGILPGELLALRYSMAALLLFLFLIFKDPHSLKLNLKDTLISIALGIFGYALFSSMFFYALTGLSASLTVLLLYTYPIIVTILSRFILKEKLTTKKILSLILVTVGMFLLVSGEWKIDGAKYFISGLGAAFFYSLYIIYSRKYLERVAPFTSSFYVQIGAGLILSLIHFQNLTRPILILNEHFIFILAMAFICSFLAMSLFLSGLQKISSSETSILSTTEPISGVLIAYFFLGEKLSIMQLFGAVLIIIGLVLIGLSQRRQNGN